VIGSGCPPRQPRQAADIATAKDIAASFATVSKIAKAVGLRVELHPQPAGAPQ
jgi:hypothetical protein